MRVITRYSMVSCRPYPSTLWHHDIGVRGKLLQEERLFFQTGAWAEAMGPLDLQHDAVVKHIGPGLPTRLVNAGDRRAGHAMATHESKHRPRLQHGISSMGLAVQVIEHHEASFTPSLRERP